MSEAAPERIGAYRLRREIGEGGMATVYLAEREGPDGFRKRVALKVIRAELARDASFRAMFIEEAKIAQTLAHGNVVQVFELGQDAGRYFIAMEYVEGISLLELLKKAPGRRLPLELALYVTRCLCRALSHAHTRRTPAGQPLTIVHRDVSPHNALVAEDGQVKLTDFGIARAMDNLMHSRPGTIKGKVHYMAPEQARGDSLDPRADIYALGLLCYETIAGDNPLGEGNIGEVLERAVNARVRPLDEAVPGTDSRVCEIVHKALSKQREARYDSAAQLLKVLEALRIEMRDATDAHDLAQFIVDVGAQRRERARSLDGALARVLGGDGAGGDALAVSADADTVATPEGEDEISTPTALASPPLALARTEDASAAGLGVYAAIGDTRDAESAATADTKIDAGAASKPRVEAASRPGADSGDVGEVAQPPARGPARVVMIAALLAVVALAGFVVARKMGSGSRSGSGSASASASSGSAAAATSASAGTGSAAVTASGTGTGSGSGSAAVAASGTGTGSGTGSGAVAASGTGSGTGTGVASARPKAKRRRWLRRRGKGTLRVNVIPWARVSVDGRYRGNTPLELSLPVGRHRIKLINPKMGRERTVRVRIEPGKETAVNRW